MNDISHKQAIQLIHRRTDGLLTESQRLSLEEHLHSCDACRAYAVDMDGLSAHLQNEFHRRWDDESGPSQNVFDHVTAKARRIPVANRISFGAKLLAGAMALVVLGVAINFVVSQLQSTSPAANATETVDNASLAQNRLLAFASDQNGNFDIYTMHADGTDLTNLTNNPASDTNPIWSPDGKYIAFESDRDGFMQIYRMDANGSNVIQLTREKADHKLPLNRNGTHNPWSPDGSRLLFLQEAAGKDMKTLYSIDINGENKITLANGRISLYDVSWSPGGKHIAYLLDISPTTDKYVPNLYVVEPDGSNDRELKKLLPAEKQSDFIYSYYWSSNGQSIFLPASATDSLRAAIYQLDLQTNTFLNETETKIIVTDWSEGGSLIKDINQEGMPYVWERSDGTSNTFEASKAWDTTYDPSIASAAPCSLDLTRSTQNNFAFGVYCPDAKFNLYWTNADGSTIKQLLTLPTDVDAGGVGEIAWSPDDQYIAFNITSADKTDMYVVKVEEMLANPSSQPLQVSIGKGNGIPSWQPVSNHEIVQEEPTLEPTQVHAPEKFPPIGIGIENGEWIAFIGGEAVPDPIPVNQDVYMIHPDGTGLVNLTQSPAYYYYLQWSPDGQHLIFIRNTTDNKTDIMSHHVGETSPEVLASTVFYPVEYNPNQYFEYSWSPDSKQIAFLDKRAGNYDIYTIYADGRSDAQPQQLTNDPGQEIDFAWSPDGSQIAYQKTDGEQLSIMVMNADGSNKHEVARGMGRVLLRWSMDRKSLYVASVYLWADVKNSHLECEACVAKPAIYRIDLDDQSVQQVYYEEDSSKVDGWYLDDAPSGYLQNTLYFMRVKPQSFLGIWGTWFRADDNSVEEIGELDPHQTCKTTTGNILNEHISPNPRFSVISNFCADGFDLYLADRESPNPEQKLVHLLRLPLNTWGQGGDNATLPILWSPDGHWLVYDDGNQSVYLLDIEQILRDPTTEPVILFQSDSNLFTFAEVTWQPKP